MLNSKLVEIETIVTLGELVKKRLKYYSRLPNSRGVPNKSVGGKFPT